MQQPRPQADLARPAAAFRIVAFGSSSTEGVGATSAAESYPAQLERLFNDTYRARPAISVINRGVGGDDIDDMLKRLYSDILARRPDVVVWQVGSNDPLRGVPIDRFQAELRAGISAIRATGAEVILIEPQWCPAIAGADASNRFVNAVREVGAEQHAGVLRRFDMMHRWLAEGLVSRRDLIGPDGLHMTDKSYAMLARSVFDQISRSPALMARTATPAREPGDDTKPR